MRNNIYILILLILIISFSDDKESNSCDSKFINEIQQNDTLIYNLYKIEKKIKDIGIKIKSDSILIQKIVVKNLKNIKDTSLVNDTLLIKKQFIENEKIKSIQNNLIKYNDSLAKLEKEYIKAKEINKNSKDLLSKITENLSGNMIFKFNSHIYYAFIVDLNAHNLTMHYKNENKSNFFSLENLKVYLQKNDKDVLMLTNGGMYTPNSEPQGLYIENNVVVKDIDSGYVDNTNFYLKPNGIFYLKNGKPNIKTTEDFMKNKYHTEKSREISFATQSGPMLIINGNFHDKFNYGAQSTKLRSGVGIINNSKMVFIISDKHEITFHEFATIFKDVFNCKNALFLDGTISNMYLKNKYTNNTVGQYGVIIAVTKK